MSRSHSRRIGSLVLVPLIVLTCVLTCVACYGDPYGKARRLHYVDDRLVESDPPPPRAYEAYLRARLALERDPQDLTSAREQIEEALRWDPKEPQLWTTRAEVQWLMGDLPGAEASLARALDLRPGYPAATQLRASLRAPASASASPAAELTP